MSTYWEVLAALGVITGFILTLVGTLWIIPRWILEDSPLPLWVNILLVIASFGAGTLLFAFFLFKVQ